MDYLKHYNLLIERGLTRQTSVYTENHHIIPRCLGGSDDESNLVQLTPEEHYVAHQLLVKIYPDNKNLAFAANMMCTNRPTNKLYGWIRKRISDRMIADNPNKNGDCNRKRRGKYNLSEKAKLNISKGLKSQKVNVGSKNGMFKVKPWNHPRSTPKTKEMWGKADIYYEWWINSGLEFGQNAMAREFNEKYSGPHNNMIKYFRNGWVPLQDEDWINTCKI